MQYMSCAIRPGVSKIRMIQPKNSQKPLPTIAIFSLIFSLITTTSASYTSVSGVFAPVAGRKYHQRKLQTVMTTMYK